MLIFNVDTIAVQSLNNVKWVNDCYNSNPAILQLYHGENKLIWNKMMSS
jgi:hypothetical protein